MGTGTAWTILLAAAPTSSGWLKCTFSPVLHGLGRLAKPGAKRQTQEAVAGWPDLDRDFAEEPGLIEPGSTAPFYANHFGHLLCCPVEQCNFLLVSGGLLR